MWLKCHCVNSCVAFCFLLQANVPGGEADVLKLSALDEDNPDIVIKINPLAMLDEDWDADLDTDSPRKTHSKREITSSKARKWACLKRLGVVLAVSIGLVCVGFIGYFLPQYFDLREQCREEWGPGVADWCAVKVYHPDGLFQEPSCGCRVITPPNCHDHVNKTLDGDVFLKLGSEVTVAVYGGYCSLVGDIPEEITTIESLTYISFVSNKLSGSIPEAFGHLNKTEGKSMWLFS